ncbi:MAG: hypothetical protein ACOY0T_17245 [Myxococcota bacterium]
MNIQQRKNVVRWAVITAAALVGIGVAGRVYAGSRSNFSVTVNTASRFAQGHMGGAFNSSNTVEFIGCSISTTSIFCTATNPSGASITCNVAAADYDRYAKVVAAIDSDSFINFAWAADGTTCTSLRVNNSSFYSPKLHP